MAQPDGLGKDDLDTYRHKQNSDLILNGWDSLEHLRDQIVATLMKQYDFNLHSKPRP